MNKALTSESSSEDEDESDLPALPTGTKNYMTPQGYDRMRSELLQLIDDERPKVVEIVHWAASGREYFYTRNSIAHGCSVCDF